MVSPSWARVSQGVLHPPPAAAQPENPLLQQGWWGAWHLLAPAGTNPGPGSEKGLRAKPKEEISQTNISFPNLSDLLSDINKDSSEFFCCIISSNTCPTDNQHTNMTHLSKLLDHKSGVRYVSNEQESGTDVKTLLLRSVLEQIEERGWFPGGH